METEGDLSLKYLIINPYFEASNGVGNYSQNIISALKEVVDVEVLANQKNLDKQDFQKEVFNHITTKYGTEEVIIEAPEARASTLLLPENYKVHVRLHCPLAVAQKYDGHEPNQSIYSEELRVIHKAQVVSSPSYGLLKEMENEYNSEKTFVFKNPYSKEIKLHSIEEKEYDVAFLGRFQKLKGIEYLNPILERLPEGYKVLLIGKNSSKFKLSKNIKCDVTVKEQIVSNERFELIGKAKCLMMLSRFENCSMVILEALAAGTVVMSWNVGGNAEIADSNVLKVVPFEDIPKMVSEIKNVCTNTNYPSIENFKDALNRIDADFINGLTSVVNMLSGMKNEGKAQIYKGLDCSNEHSITYPKDFGELLDISSVEENPFGRRVLGFTISNEHIEEMWVPVVRKLGLEARYICRRPLGFHTVFKNPFPVEEKEFTQYDWIKNKDRLLLNIYTYKPNKLLFHNGLHPMYQDVLDEVKKLGIPIIYSELGWFPQKDHVYFDRWGTNGQSYLASLSAEAFCKKSINDNNKKDTKLTGDHVLIITQLENDTNLIVNSPLFKKNYNFIEHVLEQIPKREKVIIKTHPLDKNWEALKVFESERVQVIKEGNLDILIQNAKAVIGINSTVLIQALEYDVNIYSYGYGLLDNKGVTISCIEKPLSQLWTSFMHGSRKRRRMIIEGFKERQINIRELENLSLEEIVNNVAFEPFLFANEENFTKMEQHIKKLKIIPTKGEKETKPKSKSNENNVNKKIKTETNKVQSTEDLKDKKVTKKTNTSELVSSSKKPKAETTGKTGNNVKAKPKRTKKQLWSRRWTKFKKNPLIVITYIGKKIKK